MRAGVVLEALLTRFRVSLLVLPLYGSPAGGLPAGLSSQCEAVRIVPPVMRAPVQTERRWWRRRVGPPASAPAIDYDGWRDLAGAAFGDRRFDAVHLFRLATLPLAEPYLRPAHRRRPLCCLDLDDIESRTRRRLATLYRMDGQRDQAAAEAREARQYARQEAAVLREFDRVYVCSAQDRAVLAPHATAELHVLPNAIRLPRTAPLRSAGAPFCFFFVGTLSYFPNEDAVLYFCREILPLLRARSRRVFRVVIAGTGASPRLVVAARAAAIDLVGPVADVAPWYGTAGAVIVPVRGGGGTRIKVLEAFAYGRPVVSTPVGVEGIDARDGEHVLLGDSPDVFAAQCLRLMDDTSLADRLAANALRLVTDAYTVERVTERLVASFALPAR